MTNHCNCSTSFPKWSTLFLVGKLVLDDITKEKGFIWADKEIF